MGIKRIGSQASAMGPSEWFTGTVQIDPLFHAPAPALVQGARRDVPPETKSPVAPSNYQQVIGIPIARFTGV
jgi:hypothetical protein